MMNANLDEAWRPSIAHFMIKSDADQLFILVDKAYPDAWRQEPYFSNLQHWAVTHQITVSIGMRKLAIFKDHVDDLGDVTEDEVVAFIGSSPERGSHVRAIKMKKNAVW